MPLAAATPLLQPGCLVRIGRGPSGLLAEVLRVLGDGSLVVEWGSEGRRMTGRFSRKDLTPCPR
jgi:hypothetical protein